MDSLERVLREHAFLHDLGDDHVRLLVGCAKNARFSRGEFLLREGEEESTFYLIRQGTVSIEAYAPGRPAAMCVETVGPNDVLGVSWMFPGTTVDLDARAREPVVAFALDGACLRGKVATDDRLGYVLSRRLLQLVSKRLVRLRLQMLDVYGSPT